MAVSIRGVILTAGLLVSGGRQAAAAKSPDLPTSLRSRVQGIFRRLPKLVLPA